MGLWIAMAALAATVCLPLLLALRRAPGAGSGNATVAIYRDQLSELARDADRGVIAPDEAAAARAEIARRLIRANASVEGVPAKGGGRFRNAAALVIVAMPVAAVGLYLTLGSPGVPDQPLAQRFSAPPAAQDIAALVARVEQQLKVRPDDGRGWDVLAPVYLSSGRAADAVTAFQNAIRLMGSTAQREGSLGEAIVAANGGRVTTEARAAFDRAHALAPADPKPRFYLAVALGQEGKIPEAIAAWQALLADAPQDAQWVLLGRAELARLQGQLASPAPAGAAPREPTDADIAAAQDLPADVRAAMIEGMVASLATRLQSEPGDAKGWAQLVRSYIVLGRPDDARAALTRARAALIEDKEKMSLVEEAARSAGLVP